MSSYLDVLKLTLTDPEQGLVEAARNGFTSIVIYIDSLNYYPYRSTIDAFLASTENYHFDTFYILQEGVGLFYDSRDNEELARELFGDDQEARETYTDEADEVLTEVYFRAVLAEQKNVLEIERSHGYDFGDPRIIFRAAENGQTELVKSLLPEAEFLPDRVLGGLSMRRLFLEVAAKGNVNLLRYFLDHGFSPNYLNEALVAAAEHDKFETMFVLLSWGADIHYNQDQALLRAVSTDKYDSVKFLLDSGADVHTQDNLPLREAINHKNIEIIALLLRQGADPTPLFL
jgi:hypothetical protein